MIESRCADHTETELASRKKMPMDAGGLKATASAGMDAGSAVLDSPTSPVKSVQFAPEINMNRESHLEEEEEEMGRPELQERRSESSMRRPQIALLNLEGLKHGYAAPVRKTTTPPSDLNKPRDRSPMFSKTNSMTEFTEKFQQYTAKAAANVPAKYSLSPQRKRQQQQSPPQLQRIASTPPAPAPREKRIVSLDSASYEIYKKTKKAEKLNRKKERAHSTGGQETTGNGILMRKLTAEDVDLTQTPLSALRSCSEFQRLQSLQIEQAQLFESMMMDQPKKRNVFSRLYNWARGKSKNKREPPPRGGPGQKNIYNDEDTEFLVERFKFNPANLLEDEDYDYTDYGPNGKPSSIVISEGASGSSEAPVTGSTPRNSSKYNNNSNNNNNNSDSRASSKESNNRNSAERGTSLFEKLTTPRGSSSSSSSNNKTSVTTAAIGGEETKINTPRSRTPSRQGAPHSASSTVSNNTNTNSNRRQHQQVPHARRQRQRNNGYSGRDDVLRESSLALDFLFGFSFRPNRRSGSLSGSSQPESSPRMPMEIELRMLKDPEYIDFSFTDVRRGPNCSATSRAAGHGNRNDDTTATSLRRTLSFASLRSSSRGHNSDALSPHMIDHHSTTEGSVGVGDAGVDFAVALNWRDRSTWLPYCKYLHHVGVLHLRDRHELHHRADEILYESIRIQPFSSGAYLRSFMLAGFSGLVFHSSYLWWWPDFSFATESSSLHFVAESVLYMAAAMQLLLNVSQLPTRVQIHRLCWDSSRAVDVEVAIDVFRAMLLSDVWVVNRFLGDLSDALSVLVLVLCEMYIWSRGRADPFYGQVVNLASINILSLCCRLVVAIILAFSIHDPAVLNHARKRGLSKYDLQSLPTFVFTSLDEVRNTECSICLSAFDQGEMLISLPCDNKHSFHAGCIRQWLQRQNACPLCQKMV